MRQPQMLAALVLCTSLAVAACDRDPPEEEILEDAQGTLQQVDQTTPDVVPVPVPVPVPVDTMAPAGTATDTARVP